ncbi:ABC transporter ATP-binding protein [Halobacteriales archaeon QS_4_69_34]|nr:MAG: ABC transporter ATP-binding protein [Halobacteriales archaeon QS_4_69_34]
MDENTLSRREKGRAIAKATAFKPLYTGLIAIVGIATAVLEGIGLSFILPIVELVRQPSNPGADADGLMLAFVRVYEFLGVPFTIGSVILGVAIVMVVRYTMGFLNIWLREILQQEYVRHLQTRAFENALNARVGYFDREGSDNILNAIVTQAVYGGRAIATSVQLLEKLFLATVFGVIAFILAPRLTLLAAIILGALILVFRYVIEPGYTVGARVAQANERIQRNVQAGTQGIREIKLFGITDEIFANFNEALDIYVDDSIKISRTEGALNQFYQLAAALVLFLLIYLALTVASLTLAALGLFLFTMFRLAPILSTLNDRLYKLEGHLPHLIRTQQFIEELGRHREPVDGGVTPPKQIHRIAFDEIRFAYDDEAVLHDVSFAIESSEFVAFVGQSGAGKSTIASLLARMYEPEDGTIRANGTRIDEFDIDAWRSRIAYVRQNHFVFDDTLRYNLTLGKRDADRAQLDRVCAIARVDEFFDDLPDGYDTNLGEDGVQLSGGQRQRVAIARALLKDAEILLLDEATSDLDSNLEEEIQGAIERMDGEYMTIAIAHRLSTVQNADRIYTIEDGRITESGDHDELLENDGKYSDLYQHQVTD